MTCQNCVNPGRQRSAMVAMSSSNNATVDGDGSSTMSSRALTLYRAILRAHSKYLPQQMKELGDSYVKSEFRLHKDVTKQEQLDHFFAAWEDYLNQILTTARAQETVSTGALDVRENEAQPSNPFSFGRDLSQDLELTEEQVAQLEKLREETKKARKP